MSTGLRGLQREAARVRSRWSRSRRSAATLAATALDFLLIHALLADDGVA